MSSSSMVLSKAMAVAEVGVEVATEDTEDMEVEDTEAVWVVAREEEEEAAAVPVARMLMKACTMTNHKRMVPMHHQQTRQPAPRTPASLEPTIGEAVVEATEASIHTPGKSEMPP